MRKLNLIHEFLFKKRNLCRESWKKKSCRIFNQLPTTKQVMAVSATYPTELAALIERYMKNPVHVRLGQDSQVLEGMTQYACRLPGSTSSHRVQKTKSSALFDLLGTVSFSQCLVFSNYSLRAQALAEEAEMMGWPGRVYILYTTCTLKPTRQNLSYERNRLLENM